MVAKIHISDLRKCNRPPEEVRRFREVYGDTMPVSTVNLLEGLRRGIPWGWVSRDRLRGPGAEYFKTTIPRLLEWRDAAYDAAYSAHAEAVAVMDEVLLGEIDAINDRFERDYCTLVRDACKMKDKQ